MHRARHLIISAVMAFALLGGFAPVTQTAGQATSGLTSAQGGFGTTALHTTLKWPRRCHLC